MKGKEKQEAIVSLEAAKKKEQARILQYQYCIFTLKEEGKTTPCYNMSTYCSMVSTKTMSVKDLISLLEWDRYIEGLPIKLPRFPLYKHFLWALYQMNCTKTHSPALWGLIGLTLWEGHNVTIRHLISQLQDIAIIGSGRKMSMTSESHL